MSRMRVVEEGGEGEVADSARVSPSARCSSLRGGIRVRGCRSARVTRQRRRGGGESFEMQAGFSRFVPVPDAESDLRSLSVRTLVSAPLFLRSSSPFSAFFILSLLFLPSPVSLPSCTLLPSKTFYLTSRAVDARFLGVDSGRPVVVARKVRKRTRCTRLAALCYFWRGDRASRAAPSSSSSSSSLPRCRCHRRGQPLPFSRPSFTGFFHLLHCPSEGSRTCAAP